MTVSKSVFHFQKPINSAPRFESRSLPAPAMAEVEQRSTGPFTVAVCNQKGGVAKTTTCLSLGACLAEQGFSVLLIDLDPQAHLSLSLGFQPQHLHRTGSDALLTNSSLISVSRESAVPGLDIVPANQQLALVDKILYSRKSYELLLKRHLESINQDLYDYVLIDCAPAFGTLTLNALTAADLLLVPIQCEYYASKSLRSVLELTKVIRQKTNPALNYQLLITMYDRRNRICRLIRQQIQGSLSPIMFNTIIEIDTKLKECPAYAQPITQYAPDTRGAQQYRALAKELLDYGK
ncbi:MAG: ParA family protein [Anaerolineales bacterium]|nr:ParA family protein [Anaerolineales bacterium]